MNKIFSAPNIFKFIVLILLISCLGFNYFSQKRPDIFTEAKKKIFVINQGNSYIGRLNFWYLLAQNGDWDSAKLIETDLDSADISDYRSKHQPQELQKTAGEFLAKTNKTADEWIELAKIQSMLGQNDEALKSVTEARKIDPIRDDIDKLYYTLSK
jgi:tetratricopeptide (TPR) repeat protein